MYNVKCISEHKNLPSCFPTERFKISFGQKQFFHYFSDSKSSYNFLISNRIAYGGSRSKSQESKSMTHFFFFYLLIFFTRNNFLFLGGKSWWYNRFMSMFKSHLTGPLEKAVCEYSTKLAH